MIVRLMNFKDYFLGFILSINIFFLGVGLLVIGVVLVGNVNIFMCLVIQNLLFIIIVYFIDILFQQYVQYLVKVVSDIYIDYELWYKMLVVYYNSW